MNNPVILDGGDRRCVELLLQLRRVTVTVPAGTAIHLIASDPAAPLDVPAWCHLTGHTYLGSLPDTSRSTYALRVAADAGPTDPDRPWRPAPTGP